MAGKKADQPTNLDYRAVRQEILAGQIRPVYVLTGSETYLISRLVQALRDSCLEPSAYDFERIALACEGQPSRLDFPYLMSETRTPPFLSKRKLIEIRDSGLFTAGQGKKKAAPENSAAKSGQSTQQARLAAWQELLTDFPDSCCLILVESKVDKRLKSMLDPLAACGGALVNIEAEAAEVLRNWIAAICRQAGVRVTVTAADSLIDRCEGQMGEIERELKKALLYLQFTAADALTDEIVNLVCRADLRGNIFQVTDALAAGRTDTALRLVGVLLEQREPVQLIHFMLTRQIKQLLCAGDCQDAGELARRLKVMPFVARRLLRQASRLSPELLEELLARCVDADLAVKSGQMPDRLALDILLIQIGRIFAQRVR